MKYTQEERAALLEIKKKEAKNFVLYIWCTLFAVAFMIFIGLCQPH